MRVTCSTDPATCHETLIRDIKYLGIKPWVTPTLIRAYYEGPDDSIGQALLDLFSAQPTHEIHMGDIVPKK